MKYFTRAEIARVRWLRMIHRPVAVICQRCPGHTRDEVIEAIDATIRFHKDGEATSQVNGVLSMQAAGIPLINGREMDADRFFYSRRYQPMFN